MHAQDCYLAYIDPTGRKPTMFMEHRVYNKELFVSVRRDQYGNHHNEDERRDVLEISKRQFDAKML